jgi:hypothetical protein
MATSGADLSRDIPHLKLRLLEIWETINAYVTFVYNGGPPPEMLGLPTLASPLPDESQLDIARRWVVIFREEIETVKLVRQAVAHAKPVSENAVTEAVRVGERLLGTLHAGLSDPAQQRDAATG